MTRTPIFQMSRLDSKLAVVFVVIGLVPLLAAGFLAVVYANRILYHQVMSKLQVVADSKAQRIEGYMLAQETDVLVHSLSPTVGRHLEVLTATFRRHGIHSPEYAADSSSARTYFTPYAQQDYDNVLLISADGDIVFSVFPTAELGANLRTASYQESPLAKVFENVGMLMASTTSKNELDAPSGKHKAFTAAPVFGNGVMMGALAVQMDKRETFEIARDYTGLGESGETLIGRREGDTILVMVPTRHDPAAAFQRRVPMGSPQQVPLEEAIRGNNGIGLARDYRGIEVLAAWRYLPSLRSGLVVKIDTSEAFAPVRTFRSVAILFGVLASLLIALLAAPVSRHLSRPIRKLEQATRAINAGDLTRRAGILSSDEVGNLAVAFNQMADTIQRQITALSHVRDELERRVEERTADLATTNRALQKEVREHQRAEESLRLLGSAVEQSKEAIVVTDAELDAHGPRIRFVNPAFTQMTGYTAEEALCKTSGILQGLRTDKSVLSRLRQNLERGEAFAGEAIHYRKDGQEFDMEWQVAPIRNGTGRITHFVAIQRDITLRKRAQGELEDIHRQLEEASRRGGMAEIATNVLHNVGNVLNSVNISTGLIVESVKKSRAASLARVVGLLREHADDLGEYITKDAKGRQLPDYLAQLSEQLLADEAGMVSELDSLRRNVEHIKEIVAMQQSFATVGGAKEMVNVVHLVEDSIRMNEGALSRHRVEIVREFENLPLMNVEKHKILQILVNLLRNAKNACDESGRADKRITVRVANGGGRLRISVKDNGVGIAPENLTRIFGHGFTTRKGGHGFGLHSGALAAKEMGGSLRVHSDGPGQGANFTLELPLPEPGELR